ncbi:MAG: hypothetical protein GF315_06895 [candidate division Zixibacteria bacterium]|nr:hypothetical protein [candidate division Zixibacteria bacterium]
MEKPDNAPIVGRSDISALAGGASPDSFVFPHPLTPSPPDVIGKWEKGNFRMVIGADNRNGACCRVPPPDRKSAVGWVASVNKK